MDGGKRPCPAVAPFLLAAILPLAPVLESVGEGEDVASPQIPARRTLAAEEAALARSTLELARALQMQGRWDRAVDLLRSGRAVLDGSTTPTVELDIVLGDLLWKRGELTEAEGLLRRAVAETSEIESSLVASDALYHLGEVAYVKALAVGETGFDEAIDLHRRALEMRNNEQALAEVSLSLSRLGTIEELLGRTEEALDLFRRALDTSQRSGDERGSIRPLTHIAGHHETLGELDEAFELHQRALEISRRLGDWESLVFGLCNIGQVVWRRSGDHGTAASHFEEALAASEEMGFVLAILRASMDSGELYASRGEMDRAQAAFRRAEAEAAAAGYERLAEGIRGRIRRLETDGAQ